MNADVSAPTLYEQDFYAWANQQAALLRAGRLTEADLGNIAEEIESIARADKRELFRQLTGLLLNLLKWSGLPERHGPKLKTEILIQRIKLARHLNENPSLKAGGDEAIEIGYDDARLQATAETDLPEATFSATCPWSFEQLMDEEFWPGDAAGSVA